MSTYPLKTFNTGQITLPKVWRDRFDTKVFIATETKNGLLIQPVEGAKKKKDVVFYEDKDGFGIYCENGLPVDDIVAAIKEIDGSD